MQFLRSLFISIHWPCHHDGRLERVIVTSPMIPVDSDGKGVVWAAQVQAVEVGVVAGVPVPPASFVPGGDIGFLFSR